MHRTKRTFLSFTAALLLLVSISSQVFSDEKSFNITIILNQSSTMHEESVSTLVDTFKSESLKKTQFNYVYSDDQDSIRDISTQKLDYIVSVGVKSAKAVLETKPDSPVLFTLIPKSSFDFLVNSYKTSLPENYSAIFLTQPLERKFNLAKLLLAGNVKAGMAVSAVSEEETNKVNQLAANSGISLNLQKLSDYNKPIDALDAALDDANIFIAKYDNSVLNKHTVKFLLYMAYKKNIPVIGYSSGFTRAGAVASVYSTPIQIGKQSAELLKNHLERKVLNQQQYPVYFTVSVNERVRRILRLEKLTADKARLKLIQIERGGSDD